MKGRICTICGKPGGMPFTLPLRDLGFSGDYCHLKCLEREKKKRKKK